MIHFEMMSMVTVPLPSIIRARTIQWAFIIIVIIFFLFFFFFVSFLFFSFLYCEKMSGKKIKIVLCQCLTKMSYCMQRELWAYVWHSLIIIIGTSVLRFCRMATM